MLLPETQWTSMPHARNPIRATVVEQAMRELRLLWLAACLVLLTACVDPMPAGGGRPEAPTSSGSPRSVRVDVYEALIRHLVNPEGTQPIYVLSDLCHSLLMMKGVSCPDRLSGRRSPSADRVDRSRWF